MDNKQCKNTKITNKKIQKLFDNDTNNNINKNICNNRSLPLTTTSSKTNQETNE